jgi:hypothetical protein
MADGPLPLSCVKALLDLGEDDRPQVTAKSEATEEGDDETKPTRLEIAQLLMAVTPEY